METEGTAKISPVNDNDLKQRKKIPDDKEEPEEKPLDRKIKNMALKKMAKKKSFFSDVTLKPSSGKNFFSQLFKK